MTATALARALFGAVAAFLLADPASACLGKSDPALDDNFANPDPGWPSGDNVATTTQGLVVKPPANGSTWVVNSNYTLDGSDLCVTVALPATLPTPANEDTVGDVGVPFWKRDNDNYYMAAMSPDGVAVVSRYLNGQWATIVNPVKNAAIKTDAGAVNELEITVKGNAGSFYINGTKIGDFRGQAPAGGGPPGVYAESGPSVTNWVFSRVQLYSLPP